MKTLKLTLFVLTILLRFNATAQEKTIALVHDFNKIIISPHIAADFVKGDKASIVVESINVPVDKFQFEIKNGTLQVYLKGAKTFTKSKKEEKNGWKQKTPIYKNTIAKVTITYVNVNTFSVRGEEKINFNSTLQQQDFTLRVYGASEVAIKEAILQNLKVTIYGNSDLFIAKGVINKQRITAYGESNVRSSDVQSSEAKITAYGDGIFQFNASEKLKITAYGEAQILYKGNPEIKKGIVIGEATIRAI
ncbi:MAG: head GIN domain-containing protein [Winogradskyella sp.]